MTGENDPRPSDYERGYRDGTLVALEALEGRIERTISGVESVLGRVLPDSGRIKKMEQLATLKGILGDLRAIRKVEGG